MIRTTEAHGVVVGVDPDRSSRLPLAWAADAAARRGLGLHLVAAVPTGHARHQARTQTATEALHTAVGRVHARQPGVRTSSALVPGSPAGVLAGLSREAAMVVLGSRRLSRTEEFLSAGSLVVPVTAQARCPVVVVGEAEHTTQDPPYLVVGLDGSTASRAALALAFVEADLRRCTLRAVSVRQPAVFSLHNDDTAFYDEYRLLAETTAGWAEQHPDVRVTHEVIAGSPVEVLADAAEHALAVVVGRRGQGGYTGMRVGSVVHGLLHRAHCPVITVPAE